MSKDLLVKYSKLVNIAEEISVDDISEVNLTKIGQKVLTGFKEDEASTSEWMESVKKVTDLASLKSGKKNTPFPNAANIKFPIITKACYEFSSRIYPEIVKDGKVIKARILGKDITGSKQEVADRVTEYLNYQLLFKNNEWELELDRLLHVLALIGFVCKKTYYDPVRKSINSTICEYKDLIIHSDVKSIEDSHRVSHIIRLTLNDLIEHTRAGVFLDEPVQELIEQHGEETVPKEIELIEQHTYLDLDEDDYEEPYIVTILKDTGKVLRISARYEEECIETNDSGAIKYIDAYQYFTDYHFLVSPNGKFQSVGFGILLLHLNQAINTILNQLTDAGQLSNLQGGYIDSRYKVIESGDSLHSPGEFKKVKVGADQPLKDGIFPVNFKEPSDVLYKLLGLLIQASRDLSSSTEAMSGASSPQNVKSGAVQAMIEQGMKIFTSIQKRIYRSLSSEYRKIFKLNAQYVDANIYMQVVGKDLAIKKEDFNAKLIDIIPVADPNLSSDIIRQAQLQVLQGMLQMPGIKPENIVKRIVESLRISHPEELLMSPKEMAQQKQRPDPEMLKFQGDLTIKNEELNLKNRAQALAEKQFALDLLKTQSEIILNRAKALQSVALADAAQAQAHTNIYDLQLQGIQTHLDALLDIKDQSLQAQMHDNQIAMQQQQLQAQMQPQQQSNNPSGPQSEVQPINGQTTNQDMAGQSNNPASPQGS